MSTLQIHHGRPDSAEGRPEREMRVYNLLDSLGVEYDRLDHEPAMTMEVCALIDEAFSRTSLASFSPSDASARAHAIICKNLFLTNRQQTAFYLLMMPADKKFLTKDLSAQIQSARLSFANADHMLDMLDILPGSVSVLGLMNDHDNRVRLLIDSDVIRSDFVGCHPCNNTSSLRLHTSDLIDRILPAIHHTPQIVIL